jgi:hypothetical protein
VADFAGDHAYLLNNGALRLTTELVDLRQFLEATVSLDIRTWEDSATTDFEADDRLAIYLEATEDGLTFERLTLLAELRGGSQVGDPADQLKRLDLGGALGPFTNFRYDVPERFAAVRLVVEARNNSASERYVFDNVSISGTVIPEPASAALAFVGALVAVGYGCSRRGGPQRAKSA